MFKDSSPFRTSLHYYKVLEICVYMVFMYIQKSTVSVLKKQDLPINMLNKSGKIGVEYIAP